MKILIDNGHGVETPGKRSPDGRFREYQYNRLIARAIVEHLQLRGYDASLVVPITGQNVFSQMIIFAMNPL